MDPVGLLYLADKSIAAIIFPLAETLKQVSLITAAVVSGKLKVFLKARVKLMWNTTEVDLVYVVTSLLFSAISKMTPIPIAGA
ncbi:unnamed protein product [Sphagnum balticum]